MNDTIQITISQDAYARLQQLMVPPYTDANAVIEALLEYEGHPSPAVTTMKADQQHFTLDQELERASAGIYECGGAT